MSVERLRALNSGCDSFAVVGRTVNPPGTLAEENVRVPEQAIWVPDDVTVEPIVLDCPPDEPRVWRNYIHDFRIDEQVEVVPPDEVLGLWLLLRG